MPTAGQMESSTSAQTPPKEKERELTPAVLAAAEQIGVSTDHPRFMKLVDDMVRPESLPRGWTAEFEDGKWWYKNQALGAVRDKHPVHDYYLGAMFMDKGGYRQLQKNAELRPPLQPEVDAMGEYFGVKPGEDPYIWEVAEMALSAPLLPEWTEVMDDPSGQVMFRDPAGDFHEAHPLDDYFRELIRRRRRELVRRKRAALKALTAVMKIGGFRRSVMAVAGGSSTDATSQPATAAKDDDDTSAADIDSSALMSEWQSLIGHAATLVNAMQVVHWGEEPRGVSVGVNVGGAAIDVAGSNQAVAGSSADGSGAVTRLGDHISDGRSSSAGSSSGISQARLAHLGTVLNSALDPNSAQPMPEVLQHIEQLTRLTTAAGSSMSIAGYSMVGSTVDGTLSFFGSHSMAGSSPVATAATAGDVADARAIVSLRSATGAPSKLSNNSADAVVSSNLSSNAGHVRMSRDMTHVGYEVTNNTQTGAAAAAVADDTAEAAESKAQTETAADKSSVSQHATPDIQQASSSSRQAADGGHQQVGLSSTSQQPSSSIMELSTNGVREPSRLLSAVSRSVSRSDSRSVSRQSSISRRPSRRSSAATSRINSRPSSAVAAAAAAGAANGSSMLKAPARLFRESVADLQLKPGVTATDADSAAVADPNQDVVKPSDVVVAPPGLVAIADVAVGRQALQEGTFSESVTTSGMDTSNAAADYLSSLKAVVVEATLVIGSWQQQKLQIARLQQMLQLQQQQLAYTNGQLSSTNHELASTNSQLAAVTAQLIELQTRYDDLAATASSGQADVDERASATTATA
eukprot:jgi/Chrzof1/6377/Cz18g08030.t1